MDVRGRKKIETPFRNRIRTEKNRQIYWDDVALFCYPRDYKLAIRPMSKGDVVEIDNLSELIHLDASYTKYLGDEN